MRSHPQPRPSLPTLTTDHLVLRPVTAEDLELMADLNGDPSVMVFIRGRAATPVETAEEWQQRLERQSDPGRGLGYWAGFERDAFVGWWSASSFMGQPDISGIGYRLRPEAWGRGLATEGARAMVEQAFACPTVERVFASAMASNRASRRVLEKVGMKHTASWVTEEKREVAGRDEGEVGYELSRTEWSVR